MINKTGPLITKDAAELLLDALLDVTTHRCVGEGLQRRVLPLKGLINDKQCVVKVAREAGGLSQNDHEYHVWCHVQYTDFKKWFAPCWDLSENHHMLVQERTKPVTFDELPDKVPAFFTDFKLSNWGKLGNRVVCHDYGLSNLFDTGLTKRMIKPDWYED